MRRQPNYLSERIQTEDPLGREVAAIGMNVAEGALRDGGWPVQRRLARTYGKFFKPPVIWFTRGARSPPHNFLYER